jgi:hypothetical protein
MSGYFDHDEFVAHKMDSCFPKNDMDNKNIFITHVGRIKFDFPNARIHVFVEQNLGFHYEYVRQWATQFTCVHVHKIIPTEYTFTMFIEAGGDAEDEVEYVHSFLEHCAIKHSSIYLFPAWAIHQLIPLPYQNPA